jgi:hypothetical protein
MYRCDYRPSEDTFTATSRLRMDAHAHGCLVQFDS